MTASELEQAMNESVVTTLGEMCFIDIDTLKEGSELGSVSHILSITSLTPIRITLLVYLPKELKISIVENIFVEKWDSLEGSKIDDSLLEILNVLAGHFFNRLLGQGTPYTMGLPTLVFDDRVLLSGNQRNLFYSAEGMIFKIVILED